LLAVFQENKAAAAAPVKAAWGPDYGLFSRAWAVVLLRRHLLFAGPPG